VGEAQRPEAGCEVGLVTKPVLRLLRGSAVIAQAVGLDDEPEARPEEIDRKSVHPFTRPWPWEAGPAGDRQEAAFELRVGEHERPSVERLAQHAQTGPARQLVERRPQAFRIGQVALVGFVDRRLELVAPEARGEIDECADRRGDGNPVLNRHVLGWELGAAVDDDPGPPRKPPRGH
jgi:hypothetical protein